MVRAWLANNKLRREHDRSRRMYTPFDPLKHQAGIIDLARGRNHDPGHALVQHKSIYSFSFSMSSSELRRNTAY